MTKALYALAALLICAALGVGMYAAYSYRAMTARVVTLEQTAKDFADLSVRFDALSAEVARRRTSDAAIRTGRAAVTTALENTAREDPTTAAFLATPLPAGLREAYRHAAEQRLPDTH